MEFMIAVADENGAYVHSMLFIEKIKNPSYDCYDISYKKDH